MCWQRCWGSKKSAVNIHPHKKTNRRLWVILVGFITVTIWVLNVSRPGTKVIGCLDGCATVSPSDQVLRVISLNMLHGFPGFEHLDRRLELIAAQCKAYQSDVILLQEVPWTLRQSYAVEWLADQLDMNYVYLRANGNRWTILFEEGEAILSRYPMVSVDFTELQPRAGFFEHRVALRAEILTPWGRYPFVTTHLTNGDNEINRKQAESLVAFEELHQDSITILAGDFNAPPDSAQIQLLSSTWRDVFKEANPGDEGYTCCIDDLTQTEAFPSKRIDYQFLFQHDHSIEIISSERVFSQAFTEESGYLWASDHLGLMTDFVIVP
jgi:endonuclease/exonuclease/phosphatase family metal-dependent hydrolase